MEPLTPAQHRAVCWYIGDVTGDDPFWGDPKAYVTLNSLFFPGMEAETARAAEGKRLNPAIIEDVDRLCTVLSDLMAAFRPLEYALTAFRVERYSDYLMMREKRATLSFTSTSTAGFLDAYRDRAGIALMRFFLPVGTPCLLMADALEQYAKPEEAEILLPPGLSLLLNEVPLKNAEQHITDANGEPPVASVVAGTAGTVHTVSCALPADKGQAAGIRIYEALNRHTLPDAADISLYTRWKAHLGRIQRKAWNP